MLVVRVLAAGHAPTTPETIERRETSTSSPVAWQIGQPLGIRVDSGRASFQVPTSGRANDSGVLVIVSSLAREAGPFPITLSTTLESRPESPDRDPLDREFVPRHPIAGGLPPISEPVSGTPPTHRTFHLMVRDGDVASGRNYEAFPAKLRAVGERVQVYVAVDDLGRVREDVLRDLVDTFDNHVFPVAASTFGQALDVDGDGRFTIFLSSWLSRMGHGKQAVDGFVRVADLDRSYAAPFGNRCDMMYLNAELAAGPHLRTVVAHEYTHAVVFSRKALASNRESRLEARVEEEGWLDEAMAHLAEDLHGFSRSNLDYRISAFLSKPESYRLVVEDYYSANLFRSHGNRGSTYLFLRWCADQFGDELLPALIGSGWSGIENLEATTGFPFDLLYRRWSIALASAALGPGVVESGRRAGFHSVELRAAIDDRALAGPRIDRIDPRQNSIHWNATGTSSRYLRVEGAGTDAIGVTIQAPPEARLQVTCIPLPRDLPRMDLNVRSSYDADGDLSLRVSVAGRGGPPIRLTALSWEPLVPSADPRSSSQPCGRFDRSGIAAHFGGPDLTSSQILLSSAIRLPGVRRESGPYVLKLLGRDTAGREVTAWADLNMTPGIASLSTDPSIEAEDPLLDSIDFSQAE
jgi:hypothetical protein